MGSRHMRPFTPQDSPPDAPSSNDGDRGENAQAESSTAPHQILLQGVHSPLARLVPALQAWTAHQSHAQLTILFYVPKGTRTSDVKVKFGDDYIIAGIHGQQAVVKARLAGRINPHTSSWQLEKRRAGKRTRNQSIKRASKPRSSAASSSDKSGELEAEVASSGSAYGEGSKAKQSESTTAEEVSALPRTPHPSSVIEQGTEQIQGSTKTEERVQKSPERSSPASEGSSSFDFLGRSVDTLASQGSQGSHESEGHRQQNSEDVRGTDEGADPNAPPSLAQSTTLSEESGYVRSESAGIRSLDSSMSIAEEASTTGESASAPSRDGNDEESDATVDARLITLHLDKIDGGIWPCCVSGPAPLDRNQPSTTVPHLISQRSQTSLSAALSEALDARSRTENGHVARSRSPSITSASDAGSDDRMANASTVTVDTAVSDDSTTILGSRNLSDEERFNMDPVSLTLMGLESARRSTTAPTSFSNARDGSLAFEYLRRAWKQGEVPFATERLVEDYLPLPASRRGDEVDDASSPLRLFAAIRPRLVAALGGQVALARLYLSYARLVLPSSAHRRPLLSLPITGQSTNPFRPHIVNKHPRVPYSPESHESEEALNALKYLEEVKRLDENVASTISDTEWREAAELDEILRAARHVFSKSRSQPGVQSPCSRSEGGDYDSASSYGPGWHRESGDGMSGQQRAQHKRRKRSRNKAISDGKVDRSSTSADQGLVFLVVSRAALLSFVVAGGMAVAGWWRRAAASG